MYMLYNCRDLLRQIYFHLMNHLSINHLKHYINQLIDSNVELTICNVMSIYLILQSLWRGYRVRRRIKDKALVRVCKRVMAANKAARENNKLMNRLPSMLDTLLQAQYLSTVGDVLKSFGEFMALYMFAY